MFKFLKWLFGTSSEDVRGNSTDASVRKYDWNEKRLMALSKSALDKHAEEWGVKLDRRKAKKAMLADFKKELEEQGDL